MDLFSQILDTETQSGHEKIAVYDYKKKSYLCVVYFCLQGLFEGMKAYRKQDGKNILLFRPEENATRMRCGAERMCMPAPTIDQFVKAVKATVLANNRWVCK